MNEEMKPLTLTTLSYNFRGKQGEITFSPTTTRISGRNGTGKSRTKNAFLWLMTGYDEFDKQNYDLFDTTQTYTHDNPATAYAKATLDIDGTTLTLEKRATQVWEWSDTQEKYVHSGDTYTYIVDDLEVPATKYKQVIEDTICPISKLKLMLNIRHYENLNWKVLRTHFADIAGEIEVPCDAEVLQMIEKAGAEAIRKKYADDLKALSKKADTQKATITALQQQQPNLQEIEQAEQRADELKAERAEIERKRETHNGNDAIVAQRKAEEDAIANKREELLKAKEAYEQEQERTLKEKVQAIEDARRHNNHITEIRNAIREKIATYKESIVSTESRLEYLREENKTIKLRMFDGYCENCGAAYVGKKRQEVLEAWKIKKDADLNVNVSAGKATRVKLDDLQAKVAEAEKELAGIKGKDVKALEAEADEYRKSMKPFDGMALEAEIARMEENRTEIPVNDEVVKMQERVGEINIELEGLYKVIGLRGVYESGKEKIAEIEKQKQHTMQEIATAKKMKALVEKYQRDYAEAMCERVNKHFDKVSVVVAKENKSGDLEDTCEILIDNVGDTCNKANKSVAGGEIAEVFQRHYGLSLPMFVDDAEGINRCNLPKHRGQLVVLCATEEDKELKIEYA